MHMLPASLKKYSSKISNELKLNMDDNTKRIYKKHGLNPEERDKENIELFKNTLKQLDELNKERLQKEFKEGMKNNFSTYKHYLRGVRFYYFTEFESNVWQIVQCLIIEAYSASITLTNHMFERIFKLALIQNDIGLTPVELEKWNETYKPTHKYSNWNMDKTIAKCHKIGLIESEHLNRLTEYRKSIRNGFSHYDPSAILKNVNDIMDAVFPSLNPEDKEKIIPLNIKQIPVLQHFSVNKFARDNAEPYFNYAITIIEHIERKFREIYFEEYKKQISKE